MEELFIFGAAAYIGFKLDEIKAVIEAATDEIADAIDEVGR